MDFYNISYLRRVKLTNYVSKATVLKSYGEYPVEEIKKLYLCRTAYEKLLLQFETVKIENKHLRAEVTRLSKIIADHLTLIS